MDLNIREKSYEERLEMFEKEKTILISEAAKRDEEISEKYKDYVHVGIDGHPWEKERREVTRWVVEEAKKLKEKYGIL